MSKQLLRSAVAAVMCLLIPAVGASAQQAQKPQKSQKARYSQSAALPSAYASPVQNPAGSALIGSYHSEAFFPSPLNLTITGMDQYGNLYGSMSGWRSSWVGGETGDTWARWQRVFGQDARAFYRDGKIHITFTNGAGYVLDAPDGYRLTGEFAAGDDRQPVTFQKIHGMAAVR